MEPTTPLNPSAADFLDRLQKVAGEPDPDRALVELFTSVGTAAAADRTYGEAWACWADWAWARGVPALPASRAHVLAFVVEMLGDRDTEAVFEVVKAINRRHRQAGEAEPLGEP